MKVIAREVAVIALAQVQQDGELKVRQEEQLRRALRAAAGYLSWDLVKIDRKDPVAHAAKDLAKLARRGTDAIVKEYVKELETKKGEITQLKKAARTIEKIAEKGKFPAEASYTHTARDAARGLVTKTETLTLNDAEEAIKGAESIEKHIESWTKLRDQMLIDIKQRKAQVIQAKEQLPEFVESSHWLLREVFQTIY